MVGRGPSRLHRRAKVEREGPIFPKFFVLLRICIAGRGSVVWPGEASIHWARVDIFTLVYRICRRATRAEHKLFIFHFHFILFGYGFGCGFLSPYSINLIFVED